MSWRRRMLEELDQDIRDHIERETQDNIERGMTPEEARYAAVRKFGNVMRVKEEARAVWSAVWIEQLLEDIRFGLRMLRKHIGFTAVAVLTLALGIGANTAIFSVVQGVVLAPLPYREPDRLVMVWLYNLNLKAPTYLSYLDFLDWRGTARSFQQMAAFTSQDYNVTSPSVSEHLAGREVSSGFFQMLGVTLALGRDFSESEDRQGGPPVVIISNGLWRNRFGSSGAALGKSATLDGVDYTIVGILPAGFSFGTQPEHADVYTPLAQGDPIQRNNRAVHNIACVARLRPQVNMGQAQAEMNTVQENLDRLYPKEERGLGTEILPLKQQLVGDVSGTLLLLLGAVGIVLLIASANVANLLLARSAARKREFAIRSALGASRTRIVRQLVTESLLLSLAGGALGLAIAKWGLPAVLAVVPQSLPRSENIGVNTAVLLFALGVSIAVGMLFALAPALRSSRVDLQTSLKEGGRGSTSGRNRAQSSLVVVQMALTLVLLVGAGLLFRTIRHLWEVDPGFDAQHVIIFEVGLSPSVSNTGAAIRTAYQQLIERIREIPGVQSADLTTLVPLSGDANDLPFWVDSQQTTSIAEAPRVLTYSTGPDYLRVMGIRLLRGRFFKPEDTVKSVPVVVIDSVLASSYFANKNPVGQTITFANVGAYRIIGVVGHVQHWGLNNPGPYPQSQAYTPFYQIRDQWMPVMQASTSVVVRTPLDIGSLMPAIKAAVSAAGGEQPVYKVQTIQRIVSESMSSQRFPMILLGVFSGLALLLASVGIYGVISYSVTLRRNEIGIRMTLGAETRNVFRMVIGQGLRLALAGLATGAAAALILTRLLSSFSHLLYGVGASDPLTFLAVSLVLSGVALLACYIPARRATRVDPMVALRHE